MNSEQGKRGDEAKLLYDDYKKVKNFWICGVANENLLDCSSFKTLRAIEQ